MGLIRDTQAVMEFLKDFHGCLPFSIRLLILGAFGSVVLISIMKSIRG